MQKMTIGVLLGVLLSTLLQYTLLSAKSREASSVTTSIPQDNENYVGVLDCNQFSWMQNCTDVNKQAKEHPDVPLRVNTKDGHELNIKPGTPTPMMNMLIKRSRESVKAFADYLEEDGRQRKQLANLWKAEMDERGGINDSRLIYQLKAGKSLTKSIDYKRMKTFVFYDSNCRYCKKMLPELAKLKKKHPQLKLSLIQINLDKKDLAKINQTYHLNAKLLVGPRRKELLPQIQRTPTVWIQDASTKKTNILTRFMTAAQLEETLSKVTGNELSQK